MHFTENEYPIRVPGNTIKEFALKPMIDAHNDVTNDSHHEQQIRESILKKIYPKYKRFAMLNKEEYLLLEGYITEAVSRGNKLLNTSFWGEWTQAKQRRLEKYFNDTFK